MADYSFCPKCGAVIPDKHSFCSYCGNRKQYPVLSIYEDRFEVASLDNKDPIMDPAYSVELNHAPVYEHFEYNTLEEIFRTCMDARITQCCMTTPLLLDFKQRQILEDAAKETDFTVVRTVTDVAAMAVAYECERNNRSMENCCLILAVGNGIVDIGYAEMGDDVVEMVNTWEYAQPDPIQSWGQEQKMQLFHAVADMIRDEMTIPTKQTVTIPSSLCSSSAMKIQIVQQLQETHKMIPLTTITFPIKDRSKDIEIRADIGANWKLDIKPL